MAKCQIVKISTMNATDRRRAKQSIMDASRSESAEHLAFPRKFRHLAVPHLQHVRKVSDFLSISGGIEQPFIVMRRLEAHDESIVPLSGEAAVGAVALSLLACGRNPGPVSNLLISELLKWWPGTESNRRRQPFQGCVRFFEGLRPLANASPDTRAQHRSPRPQQILHLEK